jgi:hypothetical protein
MLEAVGASPGLLLVLGQAKWNPWTSCAEAKKTTKVLDRVIATWRCTGLPNILAVHAIDEGRPLHKSGIGIVE